MDAIEMLEEQGGIAVTTLEVLVGTVVASPLDNRNGVGRCGGQRTVAMGCVKPANDDGDFALWQARQEQERLRAVFMDAYHRRMDQIMRESR